MHTLHLLRHAKSSWDAPELEDRERPLAPRGERAAKRMARHLRDAGVAPDLVLCSPAVRARATLDLVRPALGDAAVELEDGLYAASAGELFRRLRALPEDAATVLVIGHNPGLQELALGLAGDGDALPALVAKFPTGALATLDVPSAWAELDPGAVHLRELVTPRALRG